MLCRLAYGSLLWCLPLWWTVSAPALWAKKSDLGAKPKFKPLKEQTDYLACRKMAVEQAGRFPDRQSSKIKRLLAECRDRHPAAAEYIDCKKQAFQRHQGDKAGLKATLKNCQQRYDKLAFDPKNPLPFLQQGSDTFFAGAGLNIPRKLDLPADLRGDTEEYPNNFSNFNCTPLVETFLKKKAPEYLLFGNDPRAFGPLRRLKVAEIRERIKFKPAADKEFIDPVLGQVSQLGKDPDRLISYFPTSYCYFERRLGDIFDGLKVYYLMDPRQRTATPYFAIAFYKEGADIPTVSKLTTSVVAKLGAGYKAYPLKGDTTFVAKKAFDAFDEEGDPRNVCAPPRDHELVAIIRSRPSSKKPDYLVLSNIGNLCKHGDRLTGRISE